MYTAWSAQQTDTARDQLVNIQQSFQTSTKLLSITSSYLKLHYLSTRSSIYFEFIKDQRPQGNLLKNFYPYLNLSSPLGGGNKHREGRKEACYLKRKHLFPSSLHQDSAPLTQLSLLSVSKLTSNKNIKTFVLLLLSYHSAFSGKTTLFKLLLESSFRNTKQFTSKLVTWRWRLAVFLFQINKSAQLRVHMIRKLIKMFLNNFDLCLTLEQAQIQVCCQEHTVVLKHVWLCCLTGACMLYGVKHGNRGLQASYHHFTTVLISVYVECVTNKKRIHTWSVYFQCTLFLLLSLSRSFSGMKINYIIRSF